MRVERQQTKETRKQREVLFPLKGFARTRKRQSCVQKNNTHRRLTTTLYTARLALSEPRKTKSPVGSTFDATEDSFIPREDKNRKRLKQKTRRIRKVAN